MKKQGQSSSALLGIFIPIIVIAVLAVSLGIISQGVGQNYAVDYTDSSYGVIINQTVALTSVTERASESVLGANESRSNVLTAAEKLSGGAYSAFLVLANIPQIYANIIQVVADSIGIDAAIVNLINLAIIFSILAVVIYLALGRQ